MLLELSCSNFKGIKDNVTFSMVASKDKSHEDELYSYNNNQVSRISSLYGANGAGKTTLIEAVGYLKKLVCECSKFQEGDVIPRMSHKLALDTPTVFHIQFVMEGIRYAYGVSLNDIEILEEYLYHFPAGRQAKIFERNGSEFTFGQKYKRELTQLELKNKKNKLFLSTAEAWCNLAEILNAFKFFKEKLVIHIVGPDNWFEYSATRISMDSVTKKILVKLLQESGIPVIDIKAKIENRPLTAQDIPMEILTKIQALAGTTMQTNIIDVKFVYSDYELDIREESQGTQKLFRLICPLIDVLVSGKTLFYDELENSLHPVLVDALIDTFKHWRGDSQAQLIFSTHDTSLLDLDLFRRDQIWFAERNPQKATTEYYSLIELKNVRKDENIKKGYIHGKYSTIPLKGSTLIEVLEGE